MRAIWVKPRPFGARRGFTLAEAALATVIVGLGIASMMELFAACTNQNQSANQQTTAMLLASNVQETMAGMPMVDPIRGSLSFGPQAGETLDQYNNAEDFDGSRFNPPIDATRKPIPQLSQYTQLVSVMPVLPTQMNVNTNETSPTIFQSTYTGAVRVRVRILYQRVPGAPTAEVYRADWIVLDK
jgi:hypothetical protein